MRRLTLGWMTLGLAWALLLALPETWLADTAADVATGVLAALTGAVMARTSGHHDKALLLSALVANRPRDAPRLTVLRGPRHARPG